MPTNGWTHNGSIEIGEVETWTVPATIGQAFMVRAGKVGTNSFAPRLRLFSPGGVFLAENASSSAVEVGTIASENGEYSVLLEDWLVYPTNYSTAPYRLTMAKPGDPIVLSPDDQGGRMTNGVMHQGAIYLGDLDLWTFSVNAGQSVVVRAGDAGGFLSPELRVFGPNGILVGREGSSAGASVAFTATNTGEYLVVIGEVKAGTIAGTGPYRLTVAMTGDPIAVSPSDEGGALNSSPVYNGTISIGDLDVFSFTACAGHPIEIGMEEAQAGGSLTPELRLYGPDGGLLDTAYGATKAQISRSAPATGRYLLVAGDVSTGFEPGAPPPFTRTNWSGSGAYVLTVNGLSDGMKLCPPAIVGTNLVSQGAGGPPGMTASLLAQTNVSAPLALWTSIQTNQFDDLGIIGFTNAFDAAEPNRFFQLRQHQ